MLLEDWKILVVVYSWVDKDWEDFAVVGLHLQAFDSKEDSLQEVVVAVVVLQLQTFGSKENSLKEVVVAVVGLHHLQIICSRKSSYWKQAVVAVVDGHIVLHYQLYSKHLLQQHLDY
jgi:hypothetical protein